MSAPEFATLTTDDLVTGEAVALDLPPASLGGRIASGLIDLVVTFVLFFVALFVFLTAVIQTDAALAWVAVIGTLITVFLIVPTTLETLTGDKEDGHGAEVRPLCRLEGASPRPLDEPGNRGSDERERVPLVRIGDALSQALEHTNGRLRHERRDGPEDAQEPLGARRGRACERLGHRLLRNEPDLLAEPDGRADAERRNIDPGHRRPLREGRRVPGRLQNVGTVVPDIGGEIPEPLERAENPGARRLVWLRPPGEPLLRPRRPRGLVAEVLDFGEKGLVREEVGRLPCPVRRLVRRRGLGEEVSG